MVPNHPNRSKTNLNPARNPFPDEVRAARESAGLTQTQAAELVFVTLNGWQRWEKEKGTPDARPMHPAIWTLFRLRIGVLKLSDLK